MNHFFIVTLVVVSSLVVTADAFAQDACMELAMDVCLSCSVDSEACRGVSVMPVLVATVTRAGRNEAAGDAINACKSMGVFARMMRDSDNPEVYCKLIASSLPQPKKEPMESKEAEIIF